MHAPTPRQTAGPPGATDYALLVLLGAIWGLSFMFIKVAVATIPAIPMTFLRLCVSVMLMVVVMAWLREQLPPWGRVWQFITLSALIGNALPFVLISWGEETVDGALAAILMSPSPLIAAVLAHVFTADEKLNRWKVAGILLGIAGVAILMGLDKLTRLGDDAPAQLAIIAAGLCYGANAVINRGLTGGSAAGNITAVMLVSLGLIAPFALLIPGGWHFTPSRTSMLAVFALGLLSTCIGTLLLLMLVRRQGAAFMAQVNFLVPLFGVFFGAAILAERPSSRSIVGLVLILAGVALARVGARFASKSS